jgi:hypothetical protein
MSTDTPRSPVPPPVTLNFGLDRFIDMLREYPDKPNPLQRGIVPIVSGAHDTHKIQGTAFTIGAWNQHLLTLLTATHALAIFLKNEEAVRSRELTASVAFPVEDTEQAEFDPHESILLPINGLAFHKDIVSDFDQQKVSDVAVVTALQFPEMPLGNLRALFPLTLQLPNKGVQCVIMGYTSGSEVESGLQATGSVESE